MWSGSYTSGHLFHVRVDKAVSTSTSMWDNAVTLGGVDETQDGWLSMSWQSPSKGVRTVLGSTNGAVDWCGNRLLWRRVMLVENPFSSSLGSNCCNTMLWMTCGWRCVRYETTPTVTASPPMLLLMKPSRNSCSWCHKESESERAYNGVGEKALCIVSMQDFFDSLLQWGLLNPKQTHHQKLICLYF